MYALRRRVVGGEHMGSGQSFQGASEPSSRWHVYPAPKVRRVDQRNSSRASRRSSKAALHAVSLSWPLRTVFKIRITCRHPLTAHALLIPGVPGYGYSGVGLCDKAPATLTRSLTV